MTVDLPRIGPAALCMGVFDGVHAGHRALLEATRAEAAARGIDAVALVFDPHPDEVVHPGSRVPRLLPCDVVLERIGDAGVPHAIRVPFDERLKSLTAEEFLANLAPMIVVRALVMTPESAFGRDRGGTPERMREHGRTAGFEVATVDPVLVGGEPMSSSRLRAAVEAGDMAELERLGHRVQLEGVVVEGDHRGRELGFPTANLRFDYAAVLPPNGIYTGMVSVPQRGVGPEHPALVSIGVRPTFHDQGRRLVEVYLLDYDGDLYGATLTVELRHRLRDEQRFADAGALIDQMHRDEAQARALLDIA
jgi:riboflavin kinase/FMN adenylyltransferase